MDDDVIGVVNRLITTCRDGEALYRSAAETLADLGLQALFMDMANQRSQSATALSGLVSARGVEPPRRGRLAGDTRRPCVPELAFGAQDQAILTKHLRQSEERTLDVFGEALCQDLPIDVRAVVDQQYSSVRRAYGRLVTLPGAAH
jgi:uncharacterized protein (TIGR02284 family)